MKKLFSLAAILAFVIFVACSHQTTPTTTTTSTTEPDTPKMMATTYSGEVQPLMLSKCTPCHFPSKGGFKANFENYESAKKYGADMLRRVQLTPVDKGFMPFKHDKLSADEIAVFQKWVDGGMQEK